jgi:hypothetical protein
MLNIFVFVGSLIVGIVFLVTGIVKALEPRLFISHVARLGAGLFFPKLLIPSTIVFTIFECALGAALIFRLFPSYLFPITLGLLLILSAITIWGTTTKRVEDCGCYTGLLKVNPKQSLALNCFYALSIALYFLHPIPDFLTQSQQLNALSISVLASATITLASYLYYWKAKKPILDLMPIKINKPWNPDWIADYRGDWTDGEILAVFLNPKCGLCKHWLSVLRVIHLRPNFPNVVGGLVGSKEEVEEYLRDRDLPFPIVAVQPSVAARSLESFPSAIVLENGIVKDKWIGKMPREFVDSLKSQS